MGLHYNALDNDYKNYQKQHLYFTVEEDIVEGDWYYVSGGVGQSVGVYQAEANPVNNDWRHKIVATTDLLWVHATGMVTIPRPKVRFVMDFCNKPVKTVEIEYTSAGYANAMHMDSGVAPDVSKVKVNINNEITILDPTLYSKEELIDAIYSYWNELHGDGQHNPKLINWIKNTL